jgi:hypothetical protein
MCLSDRYSAIGLKGPYMPVFFYVALCICTCMFRLRGKKPENCSVSHLAWETISHCLQILNWHFQRVGLYLVPTVKHHEGPCQGWSSTMPALQGPVQTCRFAYQAFLRARSSVECSCKGRPPNHGIGGGTRCQFREG